MKTKKQILLYLYILRNIYILMKMSRIPAYS